MRWRQSLAASLLHWHSLLVVMDPSAVKGELDSLLEASSTWPTEEVLIDAYFKNESGEEVKKM